MVALFMSDEVQAVIGPVHSIGICLSIGVFLTSQINNCVLSGEPPLPYRGIFCNKLCIIKKNFIVNSTMFLQSLNKFDIERFNLKKVNNSKIMQLMKNWICRVGKHQKGLRKLAEVKISAKDSLGHCKLKQQKF